jgi:hypothetical protein
VNHVLLDVSQLGNTVFIIFFTILHPSLVFLRNRDSFGRYSKGSRAGRPGFDYRQGKEIFLFSTASRLALGLTQTPIQ